MNSRTVGKRIEPAVTATPSGENLRRAGVVMKTLGALGGALDLGIPRHPKVMRFKTHEEMNRFDEDCLARAMAARAVARREGLAND
jgi:hypothetical protein